MELKRENRRYCLLTKCCTAVVAISALVSSSVLCFSASSVKSELIDEAKSAIESADAFMGDWQGGWRLDDGNDSGPLVAQVIALGKGEYRANLLERFDIRIDLIAALEGRLKDNEVRFNGRGGHRGADFDVQAVIERGKFTGSFEGKDKEGQGLAGSFEMDKVYRVSPTLGAEPPAGAIVLFDGTSFDQWEHTGTFTGLVGIPEFIGSFDNAAAYLRSYVWSDRQCEAMLELGSDDGVKVWLNGELVHANNTARAVQPGQDKKQVTLKEQWNELLLKVTNISGGWGACVRLVNEQGKPLTGIREKVSIGSSDTGTDEYYKKNNGFLTLWEVTGPYQQQGKDGKSLFDVVFGPEKSDSQAAQWKQVDLNKSGKDKVRWKLVDGAMQVVPGTSSIVTKRKFRDFKLHLEFRTPFMPEAREQARGNSGVYLQGRYEVQILDSYALEGRDNECGGIYKVGTPLVNMCAPPVQWQSYDITFLAPRFDTAGKKTDDARVSVVHNGVVIHDNLSVPGPTGEALDNNIAEPGGIYLQDHGNPVQFRNIWLVELPQEPKLL